MMEHKKERAGVKRICVKDDVSMIQIDMERSVHTKLKMKLNEKELN